MGVAQLVALRQPHEQNFAGGVDVHAGGPAFERLEVHAINFDIRSHAGQAVEVRLAGEFEIEIKLRAEVSFIEQFIDGKQGGDRGDLARAAQCKQSLGKFPWVTHVLQRHLNLIGKIHNFIDINWLGVNDTPLEITYFDNGDLLDAEYPEEFILYQNYPNPFNPTTTIEFSIIENSYVKLDIFDIQGKHINTLISDYLTSGFYTVQWDSRNFNNKIVPSGVYILHLKSNNMISSKKLTLIK